MEKSRYLPPFPLWIVALYVVPMLFFVTYSIDLMSPEKSWFVLSIGLLMCSGCCISLVTILRQHSIRPTNTMHVPTPPPTSVYPYTSEEGSPKHESFQQVLFDQREEQQELLLQFEEQTQQMRSLMHEKTELDAQLQQSHLDVSNYQKAVQDEIRSKEELRAEYNGTIQELRALIQKKQQQILELEGTIHELTHKVKTLLQISDLAHQASHQSSPTTNPLTTLKPTDPEMRVGLSQPGFKLPQTATFTPPYPLPSAEGSTEHDTSSLLKRYIDIAQKLTGASHFGGEESRFRSLTANSYALELRRLCDSLHMERIGIILLYSQKEDKLLFASNQTKELLGWSSDKFIQDFQSLIQEGSADWKHALLQLASRNETQVRMQIKVKSGASLSIQCQLGIIPTGIFKGHVIGVIK
jgi:hypothetical protein